MRVRDVVTAREWHAWYKEGEFEMSLKEGGMVFSAHSLNFFFHHVVQRKVSGW
jgi:hypothetical protein